MAATPKSTLSGPTRPLGAPEIPQLFLPTSSKKGTYSPSVYGAAKVHFRDRKRKVDEVRTVAFLVPLVPGIRTVDWEGAQLTTVAPSELLKEPPVAADYLPLPTPAMQLKNFTRWAKNFDRWLARTQRLEITASQEPLEVWTLAPKRGGVSVEIVAIAWVLG